MEVFSRPDKLSDAETILYEIFMVRFAAKRLRDGVEFKPDECVFLECFLLHYRNLIEFLGKEDRQKTDLRLSNIWERIGRPEPAQLAIIREQGIKLWNDYECNENKISRYLHHCTMYRTQSKSWEVSK